MEVLVVALANFAPTYPWSFPCMRNWSTLITSTHPRINRYAIRGDAILSEELEGLIRRLYPNMSIKDQRTVRQLLTTNTAFWHLMRGKGIVLGFRQYDTSGKEYSDYFEALVGLVDRDFGTGYAKRWVTETFTPIVQAVVPRYLNQPGNQSPKKCATHSSKRSHRPKKSATPILSSLPLEDPIIQFPYQYPLPNASVAPQTPPGAETNNRLLPHPQSPSPGDTLLHSGQDHRPSSLFLRLSASTAHTHLHSSLPLQLSVLSSSKIPGADLAKTNTKVLVMDHAPQLSYSTLQIDSPYHLPETTDSAEPDNRAFPLFSTESRVEIGGQYFNLRPECSPQLNTRIPLPTLSLEQRLNSILPDHTGPKTPYTDLRRIHSSQENENTPVPNLSLKARLLKRRPR